MNQQDLLVARLFQYFAALGKKDEVFKYIHLGGTHWSSEARSMPSCRFSEVLLPVIVHKIVVHAI